MKHISILIPKGHTSLVNIEGSLQILSEVNSEQRRQGKAPLFTIQLVGIARNTDQRNGMFTINPDVLIQDVKKTDLIIIPSIHGCQSDMVSLNQAFIPWIIQQYAMGAEVASLCIGAFLLAGTGLLDGKQCTTHWTFANEFRRMYPAVHLVNDKITTEEAGIYTSGGAYSYLNLLLYIVEKYAGRDMAIILSKYFSIDIDRESQSSFIIFQGQKAHNDEQIKQAQEFIEANYQERIKVEELADKVALGSKTFERRFKKATDNSVIEYVQRVKVEAAKRGFETSRKNINEVMYEVGYTDTKAFRNIFKRITGLTPVEYRNKYNGPTKPGEQPEA
jgi:transcriptional regulator GlxA family with amidase domain